MKIEETKVNLDLQKILKSKLTWVIVAGIFIFIIAYGIGNSNAKIPLAEKKVTYNELLDAIENRENELQEKEAKVEEKRQELLDLVEETTEKEVIITEANKYVSNKSELEKEITSLNDQLNTKKSEIETLNEDIIAKEEELANVTGQVKEKEEAPKQLSAGKFIVGKDIPADRYKVTPVGRGSNFAVYDSYGEILEHTIISSIPDHGIPEFIVYLEDGYIVDNSAPFKFTPIE